MSTYREQVYLILDELKGISDDFSFTEEHIMYLLDKYRAFVLSQKYGDIKKEISESNYQTVCLDLEMESFPEEGYCEDSYLRSTIKIPNTLQVGNKKVYPLNYFNSHITFVSRDRLKYVGNNKYLQNVIYAAIGPDNYLYLKSSNPQHRYIEKTKFTAVFENAKEAAKLQCNQEDGICDVLDMDYPLEEGLIPSVNELIMKELTGALYRPEDNINDASDNLSNLQAFLQRNMKSKLAKELSE